jgi:CorA-like Mg2+ transporter protein
MRLPSSWEVPESIKQRFGQKRAGKQRAMIADGHLVLILHKPPYLLQRDREAVFFWRKPDGTWKYSQRGDGLKCLFNHIEAYSLAEQNLVDKYQQAQIADDYFQLLEEITPLLKATTSLHATLQSAREAISPDRDLIDLRDYAEEIERNLTLLNINTKNALDYKIAKQGEEQAIFSQKSLKAGDRLNTLAAIFFPLTAISSVFGMNLPNGLENKSIYLFWLVFLIGVSLGLWLRNWIFKN